MDEIAKEYIRSIMAANYHRGGLKIKRMFKLNPEFFKGIQDECRSIILHLPASDVTKENHITYWTRPHGRVYQYSLFNSSGATDDTSSDFTKTGSGKRFHLHTTYGNIAKLVGRLEGMGLMNMRLNVIGAGSWLSPHEEHNVHRYGGIAVVRVRFHLPIRTNEGCHCLLDGDKYAMDEGSIYFFNNGCIHASSNLGQEDRYHLVWDMMLTRKCYEGMFRGFLAGYPEFHKDFAPVKHLGTEPVKKFEKYMPEVDEEWAMERASFA